MWPRWPSYRAIVGRPGRARGTTQTWTEEPPTVLRAEGDHNPHSGGLPGVQQTVTDHLSHDRLPPVERVQRDHHRNTATTHPALHEVVALVEQWLGVPGCTQELPETARKSVLVQTS